MRFPGIARRLICGLALALAVGAGGCARAIIPADFPGERPLERSAREKPGWITQLPQEKGCFFATGIATGAASLEEGRAAAVHAAVQEVVNYLGIRAQVYYSETRTELTTRLVNRITSEGFAQVAKGRPIEMYYERFPVPGGRRSGSRLDVYVLLRIPMGVIEEEEKRLKLDRQRRLDLAGTLLREGQVYSADGDAGAALRRWLEAGRLLEGEWGVDALRQEIRAALSDLSSIVVLTADDGKSPPAGEAGPWTVRAVMRKGAEEKPLRWLPLKVRFQAGAATIEETATTDKGGVAGITLPPRMGDLSRVGVRVGVDMDRLLSLGGSRPPHEGDLLSSLGGLEAMTLWLRRPDRDPRIPAGAPPTERTAPLPADRNGLPAETGVAGTPPPRPGDRGTDPLLVRIDSGASSVYAGPVRQDPDASFLIDMRTLPSPSPRRPPMNLALVVDRSGSMADAGKMEYVKEAIRLVMKNLESQDLLSIVTYSDKADVLLSGGTVHDQLVVEHHFDMLNPMGTTNLSGGLFEGVNQVGKFTMNGRINRVILLSDGLANRGITDRSELARYVETIGGDRISVSTVGVGRDFDEDLLVELASAGRGRYSYVGDAENLPAVFQEELQGLASVVAQNITLTLSLDPSVDVANVFGVPYRKEGTTVRIRLGDMAPGRRHLVGLLLRLPQGQEGPRDIGSVDIEYDEIAETVGRVKNRIPLRVEYTRDRNRYEAARNPRVTRYLEVLATLDAMTLSMKAGDSRTVRDTLEYIEPKLKSMRNWSRTVDDPEMASLAGVVEDCVAEMRRMTTHPGSGASPPDPDTAKEIRYRLYRILRNEPSR